MYEIQRNSGNWGLQYVFLIRAIMYHSGALHLRVQRGHRGRDRVHRGRHDLGPPRNVGLQED